MGGTVTMTVGDGSGEGENSIVGEGDGGACWHVVVGGKGAPQLLP